MQNVDCFIIGICDECHIGDFYATFSVAITKSIEVARAYNENNQLNAGVSLIFERSSSGICFTVVGSQGCFDVDIESMDFVSRLADRVNIIEDKSAVQIIFDVRGIDANDAMRRVAVLNRFYHSAVVDIVQM